MKAGTILKEFYDAVIQRDMLKARTYLDDQMSFVGLFETYPSADAYIATFTQLMSIVTRLDVKVIVCEGDWSCPAYADLRIAGSTPRHQSCSSGHF